MEIISLAKDRLQWRSVYGHGAENSSSKYVEFLNQVHYHELFLNTLIFFNHFFWPTNALNYIKLNSLKST